MNEPKSAGEIYAERAAQEQPEPVPQPATQPSSVPPVQDYRSGPVIYGGSPPSPPDEFVARRLAARNKAVRPRKRTPFNVMLTMILIAVGVVLYVGNVIAVQQLLKDVSDRQAHLQQILNDQEVLKAQINRMSSLERIRSMAESDLGLRNPDGSPQWIEVDRSKVREIEDEISTRQSALQKSEQ